MSERLWQWLGAACGILYVVLIVVGNSIGGSTSMVAIFLVFLALTFFLFFLGNLWAFLRRAEGDSGWLLTTAFGGGLVAIAVKLVGDAPQSALHAHPPSKRRDKYPPCYLPALFSNRSTSNSSTR